MRAFIVIGGAFVGWGFGTIWVTFLLALYGLHIGRAGLINLQIGIICFVIGACLSLIGFIDDDE